MLQATAFQNSPTTHVMNHPFWTRVSEHIFGQLAKIVPYVHKGAVYETWFSDAENPGQLTAETATGSSELSAGGWSARRR